MTGDLEEAIVEAAVADGLNQLGLGLAVASVEGGEIKNWGSAGSHCVVAYCCCLLLMLFRYLR